MPVFVFIILLTSTNACPMVAMRWRRRRRWWFASTNTNTWAKTDRARCKLAPIPVKRNKKKLVFCCCNDEQQLFSRTLPKRDYHRRLVLHGPVSCGTTRDEFRNTFRMLKFMAFDPFLLSLSLSLLLSNDWPFSLPLTRYWCCTRRIRFERCSGLLVASQLSSWALWTSLHRDSHFGSFIQQKQKGNRNNRWSVFFFLMFNLMVSRYRKFWYDRRKRSDTKTAQNEQRKRTLPRSVA